jgi:hypothetical protein
VREALMRRPAFTPRSSENARNASSADGGVESIESFHPIRQLRQQLFQSRFFQDVLPARRFIEIEIFGKVRAPCDEKSLSVKKRWRISSTAFSNHSQLVIVIFFTPEFATQFLFDHWQQFARAASCECIPRSSTKPCRQSNAADRFHES